MRLRRTISHNIWTIGWVAVIAGAFLTIYVAGCIGS